MLSCESWQRGSSARHISTKQGCTGMQLCCMCSEAPQAWPIQGRHYMKQALTCIVSNCSTVFTPLAACPTYSLPLLANSEHVSFLMSSSLILCFHARVPCRPADCLTLGCGTVARGTEGSLVPPGPLRSRTCKHTQFLPISGSLVSAVNISCEYASCTCLRRLNAY